jgi:ribosomal protein L3 glutamine methyltransferase
MRAIIAQRRSPPAARRRLSDVNRVRCARMTSTDLKKRLLGACDCEAAVAALADFFTAHALTFGHGTDNASDEAFWLLRHVQRWRDDIDWSSPPGSDVALAALDLAVRRAESRKPLAYLTGEAWFAGLRFAVDERVLVPRSPLAEVVERTFAPWCALRPGDRVLDIGTGSGCIAIAAAHYCPDVLVDATDVSADALEVAAANVARHALGPRVRLHRADLFPPTDVRYRVIVSNPPYVSAQEMAELAPEYRHEPTLALAGGASGFEPAERILSGALSRLAPDGCVFIEVGGGAEAFAEAHPRLPATWVTFERGGDGVFVVTAAELEEFLRAG